MGGMPDTARALTETAHLRLPIAGMTCAACATRLEKALSRVDGVAAATVNFALEQAVWDGQITKQIARFFAAIDT